MSTKGDDKPSFNWSDMVHFYDAGYQNGYRMGCNHAAELDYRRRAASRGIIGHYENATLHYELALQAIVNNVFLYEDPLSKEVFAYYRPRT